MSYKTQSALLRRSRRPSGDRIRNSVITVLVCVIAVAVSSAQTPNASYHKQSLPLKSRAEQAAEQQVALSPEKIIELLRQEPGLLLQVKKVLVRKAYEQGRILDPEDLTDDALFQLLHEDHTICVLATREIEARAYVKAKPTQEEIEQQREQDARLGLTRTAAPEAQKPQGAANQVTSQEDAYWEKHDDMGEQYQLGQPQLLPQPTRPNAPYGPQPAPAEDNPQRQTEMTSLPPQNPDLYDGMGVDSEASASDSGMMSRIAPDQLPALLNASSSSTLNTAMLDNSGANPNRMGNTPMPNYGGSLPAGMPASSGSMGPLQRPAADFSGRSGDGTLQAKLENPRRQIPSPEDLNLDRPQIRRHANPYANIPSLYDLYSQVSPRPAVLEQFGANIFRNGTGNLDNLPMDLPAGPDYVLGPGDGVSIDIWGGVAQRLQRVVDRSGRLALPEVGSIDVSGRTLGDVQRVVQAALRTQFHEVEADVSLSRIRSVRVYVVGEVENPGAYDISSLSTPLNTLYAAGGPTSRGSLRHLRLYRGKELVQEVDAYDLLLHGVHSSIARIQSGDTLQVPPIGAEVTVQGMVMHPAIYELGNEKTLAEALELAGGVLPSGTYRHIEVERVIAHQSHTMLQLDMPEGNDQQAVNKALDDFAIQDGDKIRISPILPYSEKTVYLDGHVFRPGKYAYHDGMKLTDLVHSYNDLLPEPYKQHAEVIRLQAPDYTPTVLAFNLGDALAGKDQDLTLKPFDTVRVFGRYDFEDQPEVTVTGEVRDPGDHITNGSTHLRDAIYLSGGATPEAELDDAQVFRHTEDGKLKVISVNLSKALAGDAKDNILLAPKDRIFVHRDLSKVDPAAVVVQGEVARPGKYPLGEGMTAADLVRVAGGLKRGAYVETADLTRYELVQGTSVAGETVNVPLAKAMAGEPDTDVVLHDGDVLTIKQIAGWNDVGASITVKGEVIHPGTYGIQEGERLSSILKRAGGFRSDAYPYGVVFERKQVRQLEEDNREQLIRQVRIDGANLTLIPDQDTDQKMAKEAAVNQWQSALQKLQNSPPSGRLVIHITPNTKHWANTPADIQVRAGDVIFIPKKANFVMVEGSVYNPTAVTYKPGKDAGWYLRQAGGPTNSANKKAVFVIRADGSVAGGASGLFSGGVDRASLHPGDLVMVPEKAFSGTTKWKQTLESAQLAYAIGVAIQVGRSF
ncbi:MAG TPA: SLBB domain-containing protein [Terriglobales bacterium]|jgi:protein involved in polysaccharide export with SLBB domain|nr:SLBB domain-containing protein [Terriglobales bacterium]